MTDRADAIINALALQPHPEGGHYAEIHRPLGNGRASYTSIYFLLRAGEQSHWHRCDGAEFWLYHAGDPILLSVSEDETGPVRDIVLGPDPTSDHTPQALVPPDHWQMAKSTGAFTLVSCIVIPGFDWDGFVLAPPEFDIPR